MTVRVPDKDVEFRVKLRPERCQAQIFHVAQKFCFGF